jgi:ATP-dependent Lon protease
MKDNNIIEQLRSNLDELISKSYIPKKYIKNLKNIRNATISSEDYLEILDYLEYIKTIDELDWDSEPPKLSYKNVKQSLNASMVSLQTEKDTIIERLMPLIKNNIIPEPILISGAPGTGKTMLAKSIAKSINRPFVVLSAKDFSSENSIFGVPRDYKNKTTGFILSAIKNLKTRHCVIILDDIDMLPEDQIVNMAGILKKDKNQMFTDYYLNIPFDISSVIFIATTSASYDINYDIYNTMSVVNISPYMNDEKIEIIKKNIIPEVKKEHNINDLKITNRALHLIVTKYTSYEMSSIKSLIHKIYRKIGVLKSERKKTPKEINANDIKWLLGEEKVMEIGTEPIIGQALGVCTHTKEEPSGILEIQSIFSEHDDEDKLATEIIGICSGTINSSMKIAAQIINRYMEKPKTGDVFIHFKRYDSVEGTSAGIAMFVSMYSALNGYPVLQDTVITGGIDLLGNTICVGGIREKMVTAIRSGKKRFLLPYENMEDVYDIPDFIKEKIEIHYVKNLDEVIKFFF